MPICPTCHRDTPCPICGAEELFQAPRSRRFHLFRVVIDGLHGIRQGYRAARHAFLANDVSDLIKRAEENETAAAHIDDDDAGVH